MELAKEAIDKIEELVRDAKDLTILRDQQGREWVSKGLSRLLYEPKPAAVTVSTLSGFVRYIEANIDGIPLDEMMTIVKSHREVLLVSRLTGEKIERAFYIEARVDPELEEFRFAQYSSVESFVIALRSQFEPSKDRDSLVSYVSKVSGGSTFDLSDDGVSQAASTKKGVSGAVTEKGFTPGIVKLRPFRSFRDVAQVESEFLLRLKLIDTEQSIVGCALFEADGGRWRNEAMEAVLDYLRSALPKGPEIIA